MRRLTTAGLAAALGWTIGFAAPQAEARKYSSIVIDAATGEVLHQDSADAKVFPASLTKVMTLYMVFDAIERGTLSLRTRLPVSKRAAGQPPSKIKLKAGTTIAVQDAIKALITKSANDVAVVVAEALGRTESNFAKMMTKRARSLGLKRTVFRNASGLPNAAQRTTARDMAKLSLALIRDHPHHYHYFSTQSWRYKGVTYKNHNRMLKTYAGMDGIKTGYIRASGFNLSASAVRGGRRLIAVVTGGRTARSRNAHMARLLDRGFSTPSRHRGDLAISQLGTPPLPIPKPVALIASASPQKAKPIRRQTQVTQAIAPPRAKPAHVAPPKPAAPRSPDATPKSQLAQARPAPEKTASRPAPQTTVISGRRTPVMSNQAAPPLVISAATNMGGKSQRVSQRWAIQVGAFSRYGAAHLAVTRAAQRLPHLLMDTKIAIVPVERSDRVIYRARLVGLARNAAAESCKLLSRDGVPCLTLQPGDAKTLRFARAPA